MTKANLQSFVKKCQNVNFGVETHKEIQRGAEILYKAVKCTMGPSGHNVIIENDVTAPLITKDGVTVAKSINLKEKLPSIGAELLKEIAAKTNELAGDGTTTATVLGYSMLSQGIKMIGTGRSAIGIKKGMDIATNTVVEELKKNAIQIRNNEDIINVGTISANGDRKIGELMCEAINKVGQDGIITVEPAKSVETTLEIVEGMQIESGYVSPYFITNQEKLICELLEPLILITNKKLTSLADILPTLELANNSNRPLLIIGDEIDGEVLHTIIINKMKGVLMS
jgi:chaperonin GroEL